MKYRLLLVVFTILIGNQSIGQRVIDGRRVLPYYVIMSRNIISAEVIKVGQYDICLKVLEVFKSSRRIGKKIKIRFNTEIEKRHTAYEDVNVVPGKKYILFLPGRRHKYQRLYYEINDNIPIENDSILIPVYGSGFTFEHENLFKKDQNDTVMSEYRGSIEDFRELVSKVNRPFTYVPKLKKYRLSPSPMYEDTLVNSVIEQCKLKFGYLIIN